MTREIKLLLLSLTAMFLFIGVYAQEHPFSINEKEILTLPDGISPESLIFSPVSESYAYPVFQNGQWSVSINGVSGEAFDEVTNIRFLSDQDILVYKAFKNGKWYFMSGTNKSDGYDSLTIPYLYGSDKNMPLAFIGTRDLKQFFVINGSEGPAFDKISGGINTGDGKTVIYSGSDGTDSNDIHGTVVIGSREISYDGRVENLVWMNFSNQSHVAWSVAEKDKSYAVLDEKKGPYFDEIGFINSRYNYFFYDARIDSLWHFVLDNKLSPGFQEVLIDTLLITPDGKIAAYAAVSNGNLAVYWRGQPGETFDDVYETVLLPDNKTVFYSGVRNEKEYIIINNKKSEPYDKTGLYFDTFSVTPDSRHWAYTAQIDKKWYIITDSGKSPASYEKVLQTFFGPKGILIAVVQKDGRDYVLKGGKLTGPFDDFDYLYYANGGLFGFNKTALLAKITQNKQEYLSINEQNSPAYDSILSWSPENQGKFSYWGIRGKTIYRGTIEQK